ncbi:hypothetical protein GWK47_001651 [Chionoecetes opilio]|uniref:Uncharacterized protein n=1 Tax=Chionoecetes opilio TaxID=41210 RepID=A0A8J4XUM4_CHIOP|nr:hypothetical protein GWK47_001651 [Chionoecetes opilio]
MMWRGPRIADTASRWAAAAPVRVTSAARGQARYGRQSLHTGYMLSQKQAAKPTTSSIKVWYVPNPFKWLHNRMEIAALQRDWDASFTLETFKFGAIQAICTVTDLVSQREWGELRGLLSQNAIDKLRDTKWTSDQTHNLTLSPGNVQTAMIRDVKLQTIVDQKYCDIDVHLIGVREPYNVDKHSLILLEYYARFHRNYCEGGLPDWSITVFTLHSFQAVPQPSRT